MNIGTNRTTLTLLGVAMLLSVALGAGAYTTFSADRTVTMDVVTDDVGVVALSPDADASMVYLDSSDQLTVDATKGGASGVNAGATMAIGSKSSPTTKFAFSVTNNDASARSITVDYSGYTDSNSNANIQYTFYNASGSKKATLSEETSAITLSASSGQTYYVVINVDTTSLTASKNLSGTLKIDAS